MRETARSRKPGFSRRALSAALTLGGIAYLHAPVAGNPKWLRAEGETAAERLQLYAWYLDGHPEVVREFEAVIDALAPARGRVCITCFERQWRDCHRGILADRWARRDGRAVVHLGDG